MSSSKEHFIHAHDGTYLQVREWIPETNTQARAHILFIHGYADHSGRYDALGEALSKQGFHLVGFDMRGHGKSGGRRGYAETFGDYLTDLEDVRKECLGESNTPFFLMGHSFGGLLAIHYAAEESHPQLAGLLLSSPYMRLKIEAPPWKVGMAKVVSRVMPKMLMATELQPEMISSDEKVVEDYIHDPLVLKTVSPRWFTESLSAQEAAVDMAHKISFPVGVFLGEEDPVTEIETTRFWFKNCISQDKTLYGYSDVRHEPLHDKSSGQMTRDILGWLEQRC